MSSRFSTCLALPPLPVSTTQDSARGGGEAGETREALSPLPGPWGLRTPPCLEREETPAQLPIAASSRDPAMDFESCRFQHLCYWNQKENRERLTTKTALASRRRREEPPPLYIVNSGLQGFLSGAGLHCPSILALPMPRFPLPPPPTGSPSPLLCPQLMAALSLREAMTQGQSSGRRGNGDALSLSGARTPLP